MKTFILISLALLQMLAIAACQSIDERPQDSDLAGTYYRVKPGDTLAKIANNYNVPIEEIMYINGIENERALTVGQALFLPDPDPIGKKIAKLKPKSPIKTKPEKKFVEKKSAKVVARIFDFPLPSGKVFKEFSHNKKSPYDGIGIKAQKGARINASLDGNVLFVGNDGTKFGLIVILEHVVPYITVYAHLDHAQVKAGQKLKKGDAIGTVGQSGGATFPHLHFQIRVAERPKNPKSFLQTFPVQK